MKSLKQWFIPIIMLLTLFQSYPQTMLISYEESKYYVDIVIVDKIYKEKTDYLDINVIVPQVQGSTNENIENTLNTLIITWTESWITEAKENIDELFKNKIPLLHPYQLYSQYKVTNLSGVISFYIDYYQFTGGAHGSTIRNAYTIDNLKGKILSLNDLFLDGYDYKTIVDKEINKQINLESDKYFFGKDGFQGVDKDTKFYIENGNLVIYYNQYEIAPYASGLPEFNISKDLFEGNFKYGKI